MTKRRPDAKIYKQLDEEQQALLYGWLKSDTYDNVLVRARKELKLDTSRTALHDFYQDQFAKERDDKFMKSSAAALIIEQEAEKDFSPAIAKLFGQMSFECGINDDLEKAEQYLKLARAVKADLMKQERFDLELRKFAESMKSAQEKALDAIFDDIQGNAQAEELFRRMSDALSTATEDAANG